ncbi:helix-turn-helix domain protein [Brevundimonas subvibrioides ATCC 15264]|uniref:Helix-turn-helix domain protein n=2 Tax=Brevundimonas subvibrioides TaxID=74313 RepID=D9QIA5_BRESC|nr:helix-turn-helix domain protein [Brevundimonas subvibrioides ATCC 15264]
MARTVETSVPNEDAVLLGRALGVLRKRAGVSQETAGGHAGMTGQGWAKYERGQAPTIFNPTVQLRLVTGLGFSLSDLERERLTLMGGGREASVTELRTWQEPAKPQTLPIRDRVQAGNWLEADDTSQVSPRRHAFARDPRFPHADQWLSEVFGDSVDRLGIFDGDLVHCVDFEGSGLGLQTGQIVEVERLRFSGAERELSIKQVELTATGPLLWPRSGNPRWSAPLSMTDGASEDVEVRIRGLVVQSIRRF